MNAILEQLKKEYRSLLGGMGFGPKPVNFIGLDIGFRYFRAVRIKKTGSEFSVQDNFTGKLDELAELLVKMNIKDEEDVSVNFNSEDMLIKRVSIPAMPHDEI